MARWIDLRPIAGLVSLFAFAGCSKPVPVSPPDVLVTEASFRCIRDMTPVRGFFVANLLGDLQATVAAANSRAGATYPPGSMLQVIPTTAMVKHQPGRSPATNDWEFIELGVTAGGVNILGRGFAEMNMRSGLNCLRCHEPAKAAHDLVCEQTHGCLPIPLTPAMLRGLQNTDPRCPEIDLPQDQRDALAALARGAPPRP